MGKSIDSTSQLIDRMDGLAERRQRVTLRDLYELVGPRSFGPWMLLAGLIVVAPVVGDIPGVPTATGILVGLVAGQMLFGRSQFWLPNWMLKRSVTSGKLRKALSWLRKPGKWADSVVHPRLTSLVSATGARVVAGMCLGIALMMPFMEVVPFSANLAGLALVAFGLALVAHDGVVGIIAGVSTLATMFLVIRGLL